MEITFLGTGAAEGIPAVFCNCEYCNSVRRTGGRDIRSRAQVILDGELSIDFPPDAFYHNAVFGTQMSALRYLLVTHSHMDHFCPQDFILRGYKYARKVGELDIYGNAETLDIFREYTRRELKEEIASRIHLHRVCAFESVSFGGWRVLPLRARHSSNEPLVYLIERGDKRILHLTDTGPLPEEDFAVLKKYGGKPYDLITFDCTFLFDRTNENARHMGLYENAEIFTRLEGMGLADRHTVKVITHFSHNSSPSEEKLKRAEKEFGVVAAYDGLTVTV